MKSYCVTLKLYHESYGGYDHFDGDSVVKVNASNGDVARRKALKESRKTHVGWADLVKVELI